MTKEFEETKRFWATEVVKANLVWPDEFVIRFVKRNYKPDRQVRILDYGCGSGRNTVALALSGYHCIAMDYNQEALKLLEAKLDASVQDRVQPVLNRGFEIPVQAASVDAVIADGSLFYNRMKENEMILSNMRKCLKSGGAIWADWRSKKDSLFQKGVCLGDGLYRLGEGTKREGCCYFFADKDELANMYENAGLYIEAIDIYEYTEQNGTIVCSYYHVIAKNKK